MATRTVKKGESALSLGAQLGMSSEAILRMNGITSLTPGQTIQLPKPVTAQNFSSISTTPGTYQWNENTQTTVTPNAPTQSFWQQLWNGLTGNEDLQPGNLAGVRGNVIQPINGAQKVNASLVNNRFAGAGGGATAFNEPLSNTGQSLGTGASFPSQAPAPFMTQSMLNSNGQAAMGLGQNTFIPPNNGIPQGNQNGNSNTGTTTTPTNSQLASSANTSIAYGTNAANDAALRALWNQQAGYKGEQPLNVKPLSRDQVWNMKANQRRKRNAEKAYDSQVAQASAPSVQGGNASNTGLSWRVG